MEVAVNETGNLEFLFDKWDILLSMLSMGFSIALVIVVIVAAVRLGWKYWPWILIAGFLAFTFV